MDDLGAFIDQTERYWREMTSHGAGAANRAVRKQTTLVDRWSHEGSALARLTALASHQSPEVRLSAASYLLNHGGEALAVSVLSQLAGEAHGLVAPSAAALLRIQSVGGPRK